MGGIRPHLYCLPVLKTESDRRTLLDVLASGDPRFFLGTDSAPHARHTKEAACGCAGIFSAHAGIELYAEIFDALGALPKLEGFASHFGADFYGLPRNTERHHPRQRRMGRSGALSVRFRRDRAPAGRRADCLARGEWEYA